MILDYEFNQRDHKFTISYINEAGMKSFYEFNVSRFKTYIPSPTGKYTNWDGTKCDIKYTDKPNKFSYREFIEELPKNIKDKLFARYKAKLYFWDIETEFNPDEKPDPQSAKFPITTISIVNPDLTTMVLGYKTLSPEQEKSISEKFREYVDGVEFAREHNIKGSFMYKKFDCEHDMLAWFAKNIVAKVPILAGWNSDGFDWQYYVNRIKNKYEDISLASCSCKWRLGQKKVVNIFRPTEFVRVPIPYHTHVVDFMDVVRQHDYTVLPMKESMSLDWVSNQVLGVQKIKYDGNLNELYENDFEHYVYYNAIDSVLGQLLHQRFKTFNIIYNYANITHLPIGECYGKIAPSEALFFQNFFNRGLKVVYYPDKHPERGLLEGAFVKEPIPGRYDFPCCFDFASLYPTMVMTDNLSVENFIGTFYDEEALEKYISQPDKYVVIGPNVYTNIGSSEKPDAGEFVGRFLNEEALETFRKDPNYFVSVNGHVYKNDQDYAFRQIQVMLKENRNQTKYLAKEMDAQVMSVIDRVLTEKRNGDWEPFTDDVREWMSKNYSISDKHELVKYPDLVELKKKIADDIEDMIAREQSFKLLGNSAYGGSSHPAFYWFNISMARDITGESRALIKMMDAKTQDLFKNKFYDMKELHAQLGIELVDKDKYDKNFEGFQFAYIDTDSGYIPFGCLINSIKGSESWDDSKKCHFCVKFSEEFMNKYYFNELDNYFNPRHVKNRHFFELETVAKSGIWIGVKKRYAQALLWKDGRYYDHPKIKIKGLEIAKASYPKKAREVLTKLTNMLLLEDTTDPEFIHKLNMVNMQCKEEFCNCSADDVSMAIKVSDYWKNIESDSDPSGLKLKKGISFNARALAYYNWLINTKNLPGENVYGGKVKCYLIKSPIGTSIDNYFAYTAGDWPEWAKTYAPIDYDGMYKKTVLEPINRILKPIGFKELHIDGSLEFNLFDLFG